MNQIPDSMPPLSAAIDENKRKYFILQIHISAPVSHFLVEYGAEAYIHTKKRSKTIRALSIINGDYPFYTSNSSIKDYIIPSQSLRHFVPPPLSHIRAQRRRLILSTVFCPSPLSSIKNRNRGEPEETTVSSARGWNIQGQSPRIID